MKIEKTLEILFIVVLIFCLAILFLSFLIVVEIYNFITNQEPPLSLRILLFAVFGLNFFIAVYYAVKKFRDFKKSCF